MSNQIVKPFIKWAGGKGQLLGEIRRHYPAKNINKYCEPFIGGGAVLFDLLSQYSFNEVYISDTNKELINTYRVVKGNVHELINILSQIQKDFWPLDENERKSYYYSVRDEFNGLKCSKSFGIDVRQAALFIFLNRTCFNGLYRVNSKGLYNVPIGSYKKPTICDADNLKNVSNALSNVAIHLGDYSESFSFIDEKTFVYIDPPYRPLTVTASFTSYNETLFDDKEQIRLAEYVKTIDSLGAKVVASNSDPKNVNEADDFFDVIYSPYNIQRVNATRMINSNSSARGIINELLIANY